MRLGLQIELFRDNKIKQPFVQSQTNQELSMLEFREPLYQKVTQWKLYSVSPLYLISQNLTLIHNTKKKKTTSKTCKKCYTSQNSLVNPVFSFIENYILQPTYCSYYVDMIKLN